MQLFLLVVYNPARNKVVTVVDGNTRTGGNQSITLPANFSGDEVQCFISFSTAKQTVLSNSEFCRRNNRIVVGKGKGNFLSLKTALRLGRFSGVKSIL